MKKRMTYGQLKKELAKLSPQQKKQPVRVSGDEKGFFIEGLWKAREDFICPEGEPESMEPRSDWNSHPKENKEVEAVVIIHRGDVFLEINEP